MKRRSLIRSLESNGFILLRNGGDHDIYGKDGVTIAVPRHTEIKEPTARGILKKAGLL